MFNQITLVGRLTADPEIKHTQQGVPVTNFTLAVDRKFSKKDEADFIPVVAWRQLAEICNEYLHKGKQVLISGSLQTRLYEDSNGQKRKAFDVVADEMKMLGPNTNQGGKPAQKDHSPEEAVQAAVEAFSDEDIPF
jgi:single-strand DNA-binding protein